MRKLIFFPALAFIFVINLILPSLQAPKTFAQYLDSAQAHPPGTLVKSGAAIWQIGENQVKHAIPSMEIFHSRRFSLNKIYPANASDLALPESDAINYGDGVIFNYNSVIYQISGGKKYGFTSSDSFLKQGFKFESAVKASQLNLPEGIAINLLSGQHVPGTFINSGGTIYLIKDAGLVPFGSRDIFFSHGGKFIDVAEAFPQDLQKPILPQAQFNSGSLVNDSSTIWAIGFSGKRGFPSLTCFYGFGFSLTEVYTGDSSKIGKNGEACGRAANDETGFLSTASFSSFLVQTQNGQFNVKQAEFGLSAGNFQVYTDSTTDSDCANNCSAASLKSFAQAANASFGINGTYFCPADYSDCANKTNSFFWKLIDSGSGREVNFSSGLGENDPFFAFDALGQFKYFSSWNNYKDSGMQAFAGINSPSLIENGAINLNYTKLDDKQKSAKALRGAIAIKGAKLFLIQVLGATVPDLAEVLNVQKFDFALLLDGGGSSALLYDGNYQVGPGRNIANAILVKKVR